MRKPIFDLNFWKTRLNLAKQGGVIHYSVYLKADMSDIDIAHKKITDQHVKGKVLDAGCGYGRNCTWFCASDYTGIDFSPDFIEEARHQFPDYDFRVCDLTRPLPFAEKEFDWVVVNSIQQMVVANIGVKTWEMMLTNLRKVAKNILILEYVDPEVYEIL